LDALNIKLSDEEIKQIKNVTDEVNASSVGDRYPAAAMFSVFTDTVPL
jgi:hypothetical protein